MSKKMKEIKFVVKLIKVKAVVKIGLLMVSAILTTSSINNCHRSPVSASACVFYQNAISSTNSQLFLIFMFVHGRVYYYVIFRMFWCEVHNKK